MGGLRTIRAAALIGLAAALQALTALTPATAGEIESAVRTLPTPAAGQAPHARPPLDALTREFAYCAGRLSATMEHQWLVMDDGAGRTQAQRETMLSLLAAVAPTGRGRDILALRLSAKQAQAQLLTHASFGTDDVTKGRARQSAERHLTSCLNLILG